MPIGVQTLESIISSEGLYVDKTRYIYELIKDRAPKRYFLSRPRRFGKSLTCSTLEAIFLGKRELFKGLAIDTLPYDWEKRPVIHIDFSKIDHATADELKKGLDSVLDQQAREVNLTLEEKLLGRKFAELIEKLARTQGNVCVVIDEYDKPIVDLIDKPEHAEQSRMILKSFYGVLKGTDAFIHFLFITGVSRFSKVSLFSDLNNFDDVTIDERADALVGYTDAEIDHYLHDHIQVLAEKRGENYEQTRQLLRTWYNGYRFTKTLTKVYNPFSLHNCLTKLDLDNYWFASGTPTFLIKWIKNNPAIAADITTVDGSFFAASNLENFNIDSYYQNFKTVLMQTGYLTFASDYDEVARGYSVAYPNEEVRYSMTEQIMHFVGKVTPENFGIFGSKFTKALAADDLGLFCKHMQDYIKLIPHTIVVDREMFYQQIFFMMCVLFGKRSAVEVEVATEEGYMDLLMEGAHCTFVIEFKRNQTPDIALAQIERKRYWERFAIDAAKKIVLAGITFNTTAAGVQVLLKTKFVVPAKECHPDSDPGPRSRLSRRATPDAVGDRDDRQKR